MAPLPSNCLYYQNAILKNSRFFLDPSADIDVVEEVDPSGTWQVHVVKIEAGKRTTVLSETAGDVEKALEKLHVKSAEAVRQFRLSNGYGLPPKITISSRRSSTRGGVGSRRFLPEVITLCGSSSEEEEAEASDSDDSLDGRMNRRGLLQRSSHRVVGEAVSGRSLRSESDEDVEQDNISKYADDCSPHRRKPIPLGRPMPPGPSQPLHRGPPPAPGWGDFLTKPPPMPSGPPLHVPPRRPAMVPPPRNPNMMPSGVIAPQSSAPALLNVHWVGHGRKNLLVQVAPTEHALRQMAITEARMRPGGFINTQAAPGMPPPPFVNPNSLNLRAVIRRVTLSGDAYDMTSFGNDLTALFRTSSDIPKFDIEVTGVMVPVPRPRENSMSSVKSDSDIGEN